MQFYVFSSTNLWFLLQSRGTCEYKLKKIFCVNVHFFQLASYTVYSTNIFITHTDELMVITRSWHEIGWLFNARNVSIFFILFKLKIDYVKHLKR